MSISHRVVPIALLAFCGPAFASALLDKDLSKELQQIIGNEQKVSALTKGNEAIITVRSIGKWEYGDENCKLTSVVLAQKAMFLNCGITQIKTRFYGGTGQSYRETAIDSNQVASLGALMNSVEIEWHGTIPTATARPDSEKYFSAGRLRILLPPDWRPIAHPKQDPGDKFSTVVARIYHNQPGTSAEIILRVHTQVSSSKRQFDYTTEYLKTRHFKIVSAGPRPLSKLGDCWQAEAETTDAKGKPEWQQHNFFEVGGHIYSAGLYTPRAIAKPISKTYEQILDAIQVVPENRVQ